eukprot:8351523-Karenia_brevis.AAC.1
MPQKKTRYPRPSPTGSVVEQNPNGTGAIPVGFLVWQNRVRWGLLALDVPEKHGIRGFLA